MPAGRAARCAWSAAGARRALGAVDAAAGWPVADGVSCVAATGRTVPVTLGLDAELGMEKGKLADLVLDRNPLDDIRNSESLAFVMLNGRLYDAKTLDEIGDTPRPRRPFWFELPERGTR